MWLGSVSLKGVWLGSELVIICLFILFYTYTFIELVSSSVHVSSSEISYHSTPSFTFSSSSFPPSSSSFSSPSSSSLSTFVTTSAAETVPPSMYLCICIYGNHTKFVQMIVNSNSNTQYLLIVNIMHSINSNINAFY